MRIDTEEMDKLQGAEDIRGRKETLRDQLRIEVTPILSWYQRGGRIHSYLGTLLKISRQSEKTGRQIQHVSCEVNEVPHVPQVSLQTVYVHLEIPDQLPEELHAQTEIHLLRVMLPIFIFLFYD